MVTRERNVVYKGGKYQKYDVRVESEFIKIFAKLQNAHVKWARC